MHASINYPLIGSPFKPSTLIATSSNTAIRLTNSHQLLVESLSGFVYLVTLILAIKMFQWISFQAILLTCFALRVDCLLGLPLSLDPNDLTKLLNLNYFGNISDQLTNLYSTLFNFGK